MLAASTPALVDGVTPTIPGRAACGPAKFRIHRLHTSEFQGAGSSVASSNSSLILAFLAVVEVANCGDEVARNARNGCVPSRVRAARQSRSLIRATTGWTRLTWER